VYYICSWLGWWFVWDFEGPNTPSQTAAAHLAGRAPHTASIYPAAGGKHTPAAHHGVDAQNFFLRARTPHPWRFNPPGGGRCAVTGVSRQIPCGGRWFCSRLDPGCCGHSIHTSPRTPRRLAADRRTPADSSDSCSANSQTPTTRGGQLFSGPHYTTPHTYEKFSAFLFPSTFTTHTRLAAPGTGCYLSHGRGSVRLPCWAGDAALHLTPGPPAAFPTAHPHAPPTPPPSVHTPTRFTATTPGGRTRWTYRDANFTCRAPPYHPRPHFVTRVNLNRATPGTTSITRAFRRCAA